MKVKEIFMGRGRTLNMGDYNSERIEIGMTLTLNEDDNELGEMRDLEETLKAYLDDWVKRTRA